MGEADAMIPRTVGRRDEKRSERGKRKGEEVEWRVEGSRKQESGNRVERGSVSDEWVSAWDTRRAGQSKAERIRDETHQTFFGG